MKPSTATVAKFDDTVARHRHTRSLTPSHASIYCDRVTLPLCMSYADLPGFTARAVAQREYGRSKSSFIRDVDDAFSRDDTEFLKHFCVALNDGTTLDGPQATKEALQTVQSKQPRWWIETSFLEGRYWEAGHSERHAQKGNEPRTTESTKRSPHKKGMGADEVTQLQQNLLLAEQRISAQDSMISRLEEDKAFLQEELKNRRGEIDKLRGFFESVGGAADSAAKLREGQPHVTDTDVLDAESTVTTNAADLEQGSLVQRHLPTFHKALTRLRTR